MCSFSFAERNVGSSVKALRCTSQRRVEKPQAGGQVQKRGIPRNSGYSRPRERPLGARTAESEAPCHTCLVIAISFQDLQAIRTQTEIPVLGNSQCRELPLLHLLPTLDSIRI